MEANNRNPFTEAEIAEVKAILNYMKAENIGSDNEKLAKKLPAVLVDEIGIVSCYVQYTTMSTHPNISRPLAAAVVLNNAKEYNFTDHEESMNYLIYHIFHDTFDKDEICKKCDLTMEELNNIMTIGFTEGLKFFPIELNAGE